MRSTSPAVLLDVAVLDRQGQSVTDLTAEDFEVKEDGKPQRLTMVSLMRRGVASPLSTSGTSTSSQRSTAGAGTLTPCNFALHPTGVGTVSPHAGRFTRRFAAFALASFSVVCRS